jgi:ParB family chromosome partitioning protein
MSRLSLNNILNQITSSSSTKEVEEELKRPEYKIVPISVNDLVPSEGNFYSMEQIQELKIAIELVGGVKQNLNVFPIENGKYKVVAGHRRCLASWALVEEGKLEYEFLPCSIEETEEDAIAQALKEELLLILTNSQREKTDYDKVQEVERLKVVLQEYKKKEKLPGGMRQLIAKILNTSSTQVERMESISKNLTPEFKQEFKEQKVNISAAYEISTLLPEKQQEVYQEYNDKGSISVNEVKNRKKQQTEKLTKTITKSNPTVITKTTITEEVTEKEPEQVPFIRPLNIYVCSPYGGDFENFKKAVEYCKYVAAQGHIPYASHVMLHGIFQDDVYEQRLKGLQAGFEMIRIIDEIWVFGEEITNGMKQEIDLAKQLDKKRVYRSDM